MCSQFKLLTEFGLHKLQNLETTRDSICLNVPPDEEWLVVRLKLNLQERGIHPQGEDFLVSKYDRSHPDEVNEGNDDCNYLCDNHYHNHFSVTKSMWLYRQKAI